MGKVNSFSGHEERIKEDVFKEHKPMVCAILRECFPPEKSEEICDDVFLKVFTSKQWQERRIRNLGGFIRCITKNLRNDELRKKGRKNQIILQTGYDVLPEPKGQYEINDFMIDESEVVVDFKAILSEKEERFYDERYGYPPDIRPSCNEVAKILDCSPTTATKRDKEIREKAKDFIARICK